MAKTNYYGSGAIMSAGFDLNSPAPLDYKTSVISWDPHTETVINDGVTEEVQVYDIDKIPLTAVRVGMIVSDQTEGIAKILKSIPDGITLAHECIWEEVGGTQTQSDWTQSDNTRPDYIKNKPTLSTVATSGSYNDLTDKPTIPSPYTLPIASANDLGGVKVGTNLSIDANGVLSSNAITPHIDSSSKHWMIGTTDTGVVAEGQNGTDGNDGAAATISVGTVTSGSTASVTNSGTTSAAVFDFVLPKGDTGTAGEDGTRIFIGSTEADELMSQYDPDMRVGDFIIDDGQEKEGRRGNIYQIDAISSGEYPVVNVTDTGSNILGPVGVAGSSAYWFSGTAITGTGTSIVVSVPGSKAGDMYLNTSTYNVYKAIAANTWNYTCNIQGIQGNAGSLICYGNTFSNNTIDTVDAPRSLQVGDLVIDGGVDVPERKGNIYSISSISGGTYYVTFTGMNIMGPSQGGTDTKNTAGATNSTSKLYFVGALSQDTYPQTYSNSSVYATNGTLHANKLEIGSGTASGTNSVIEGNDNYVSGSYSHVEGSGNRATGYTSHVEGGYNSNFYSNQGHIEGYLNVAHNARSHVEGSRNAASGQDAHAEGYQGDYMISFECEVTSVDTSGRDIIAAPLMPISNISSTFGFYDKYYLSSGAVASISSLVVRTNDVTFSIPDSSATLPSVGDHIIVSNTSRGARGAYSHCEGYQTAALGQASHAGGEGTIASGANQTAIGKYNVSDSTSLFIIGNGTSSTRSNAMKVDGSGNLTLAGSISTSSGSVSAASVSATGTISAATVTASDTMSAANGFFQTSDIRKKDVKSELDLDKCYDLIDKCSTIVYNWKDNPSKKEIGMIAQEVNEFFPEIVNTDSEGFMSLDYSKLTVICIRVLKDLIDTVKKLKKDE